MKHRNEDEIILLAFGELSGSEAARIRGIIDADPAAKRVYDSYASMSTGLRAMHVPEHQLSTERLRDRILRQGLKETPKAPFWRLAWMPVAAGLVAVVFTYKMNQNALDVPIADLPTSVSDLKPAGQGLGFPQTTAGGSYTLRWPIELAPVGTLEAGTDSVATMLSSSGPQGNHSGPSGTRSRGGSNRGTFVAMASPAAESIEGAVLDSMVEATSDSKLIIIGSETDADTGAKKATEVPTASNVVVGG